MKEKIDKETMIRCQFADQCGVYLYEYHFCTNPEVYNGTKSECVLYYPQVRELIYVDKQQAKIDNRERERDMLIKEKKEKLILKSLGLI